MAVAIDANYGVYPLALVVDSIENYQSWGFFMHRLYQQFGSNCRKGLCFMSDRQKGVLFALEQYFSEAAKRFCCRHIYANFKSKYLGELLKKKFWAACRAGNSRHFSEIMDDIKQLQLLGTSI